MVALVTGASSGIGWELAQVIAAHGHDLVLTARREDRLQSLAHRLNTEFHVKVTTIPADLADPQGPDRIFRACHQADLRISILVNNAGFGAHGAFVHADEGRQLDMIQVNMAALTHLTKLFLPPMVIGGQGRILNVASMAAFQPGPYMAVYYASKAYVLSFSVALASELKGSGVTVTALCPGPVPTEFQERANFSPSGPLRGALGMPAADVARAGYEGMMKGRAVVIPGWRNRVLAWASRLAPPVMAAEIVGRVQKGWLKS